MVVFPVVTTVAGSGTSAYADGVGTAASFTAASSIWSCTGIFVTTAGNVLVFEYGGHRIRMISSSGMMTWQFKVCLNSLIDSLGWLRLLRLGVNFGWKWHAWMAGWNRDFGTI